MIFHVAKYYLTCAIVFTDILNEQFGEAPEEEMREHFIELMEAMEEKNVFKQGYTLTSEMDKLFFELTRALFPPQTIDELKQSFIN